MAWNRIWGQPMYEIICESCGEFGFHPSRLGAESRAETHSDETNHTSRIEPMRETTLSQ